MKETFHIQWHITDFCNLRCSHCYQDEFSIDRDLSFPRLKKIFENISSFLEEENRDLILDITGGEPFLYRDLNILIEYLTSSPLIKELGIITNGLLLNKENLAFLRKFPSLKLKLSLEGVEKESYERFRGKGTFGNFIKTLEVLKASAFEKTLMFTLLDTNCREVEKLFDFTAEYGINHFIIERFIPWGKGKENKVISLDNWMKTIEIILCRSGVTSTQEDSRGSLMELLPYKGFKISKEYGNFELYGSPCIIGKDGFAVMPEGSVFPCRRFPQKIGNLSRESLKDIWNGSTVLMELRNRKLLKGKCSICREECCGCRALAFARTGNYLEEDPLCFL